MSRWGPLGLGLAGVFLALLLLGAGGLLWTRPAGTGPAIGGPFTLVNGDDEPVSDRDFRGRYMLIYFGYTFCPDVCPTTLNEVAEALDKLGPRAARVQPIFITVDPKRDTPAAVKQYASAFTPRLIGLTGSPKEIEAVAKEYRVYYAVRQSASGPGEYTVDHSSIIYLMGPDGKFIAPIRADQSGEQMAADIAKYLP